MKRYPNYDKNHANQFYEYWMAHNVRAIQYPINYKGDK
jgi:hypothetical protein